MASGSQRGDRYDRVAIAFHWTLAALVLFNLWLGLFHDSLPRDWSVMFAHKSVGVLILVLTLGRFGWRLSHEPPALPAALPDRERLAAKTMHWLLYGLMIVLPLSGWVFSSNPARPRPVPFFGLFELPQLPVSIDLARTAHDAHELLGWGMAILVGIHILAALRHHFLLRDGVLGRMIPALSRR